MDMSKKKNGSKYFVFDSTNENNEALKKYNELWDGIKIEIEIINGSKIIRHSCTENEKKRGETRHVKNEGT